MRKVDIARLARKLERASTELIHDVGRLRSAGYGPSAEALALCARQLEDISRSLRPQQPSRRRPRADDTDLTALVRLLGKSAL